MSRYEYKILNGKTEGIFINIFNQNKKIFIHKIVIKKKSFIYVNDIKSNNKTTVIDYTYFPINKQFKHIKVSDLNTELNNNLINQHDTIISIHGNKKNISISVDHEMDYSLYYIVDNFSVKKEISTKDKTSEIVNDSNIVNQLELGKNIWKDVSDSLINKEFIQQFGDKKSQLLFFQKKYFKFNKQHPIILQYMVESNQFNEKAFEKYLNKISQLSFSVSQTSNEKKDEFLQKQADYVSYLYKEQTSHYSSVHAKRIWENTYKILKENMDKLSEIENISEKIVEKMENEQDIERKQYLFDEIKKLPPNFSEIIPKTIKDELLDDMLNGVKINVEERNDIEITDEIF